MKNPYWSTIRPMSTLLLSGQFLITFHFCSPACRLQLINHSHRAPGSPQNVPSRSRHPPRSVLRRDISTLLMVSRHSAKKNKTKTNAGPPPVSLFLFKCDAFGAAPHCADQCTNLNNLSSAARVSNTVSWRDYMLSPTVPHLPPLGPLSPRDTRPESIIAFQGVGGRNLDVPPRPPALRLQLPRCWHRRAQSRWLQPAAVSSESKQPCTFLTSSKVSQLTNCSALRGESFLLMTRAIRRILGAPLRSDLIFSSVQRDARW